MKPATLFVCQSCGAQCPKWMGRCPECGAWNSLVEERATPVRSPGKAAAPARSVVLGEVSPSPEERLATGNAEVDRVLGGGLVAGGVVLLGGDPGVGKTTLVLQVLGHVARSATVLYATGEESLEQVVARARRLGVEAPGLRLLAETSVEAVLEEVERLSPKVLAVDSIQTSASGALASAPGSLSQVRECAARWIEAAKGRAMAAILVGHITKEGLIAGPKALEHMVDTVLYLEGERYRHLKALRAQKNRFGATSELALMEMTGEGLLPVENPSAALLQDRPRGVPGTVIGVAVQGTRPLLVEIQALTSPSAFGLAKRMSAGLDRNRVQLLSAVLERALRITLGDKDLFVNVVGGVELEEPALDLPLCLAVASTYYGKPLPPDLAAFGEVGLAGEVRGVGSVGERVREASALGFSRGILPASDLERLGDRPTGGAWRGVRSVAEAADLLF
jgi:DNA repair protein RadA/Sms